MLFKFAFQVTFALCSNKKLVEIEVFRIVKLPMALVFCLQDLDKIMRDASEEGIVQKQDLQL